MTSPVTTGSVTGSVTGSRRALLVLLAVALFAVGAAEGLFGTLAHGTAVGLVLALLAPLATLWALPGGFSTRLAFTLGWVAAVLFFGRLRGEGDYLLARDTASYVLQGFGIVLSLLTGLTLRPLRPPADPPLDPPLDSAAGTGSET